MRRIAISDIHGCSQTFLALLNHLALTTADELYLLGDYIDRGPDSRGVIDTIWELQRRGYTVHCLRGNHEEMLLEAMQAPHQQAVFAMNGGTSTLSSFGIREPGELPEAYFEWVWKLPYYLEVDEYLLVHAGFNFRLSDPFGSRQDMAWIRGWYGDLNREWLGDRYIIHGHTPVDESFIVRQLRNFERDRVLDIDNGCVFAPYVRADRTAGKGKLCAFDMTNRELYFVPNCENAYE